MHRSRQQARPSTLCRKFPPRNFQCLFLLGGILFAITTSLLVVQLPHIPQSLWGALYARRLPGPCAIALYGLPRSFRDLVLPSLIRHVIVPNARYRCDYYVYFHNTDCDPGGRDDRSGSIDAQEVFLLTEAVLKHHVPPNLPSITIASFTTTDFDRERASLLRKIFQSVDSRGKPLFVPYNHPSYSNISVENVVKMWHAQEGVWNMLDDATPSSSIQAQGRKHYSRIAMLRIDVVYVTPINVYQLPNKTLDYTNAVAVIPNFARHPVNDRMIYGPYEAVHVWAAQRMGRLEQHGQYIEDHAPGDGIHSERFLNNTIFPTIRQRHVSIETHPDICFMRARADGGLRFTDCGARHTTRNNLLAVQSTLGKACKVNMTHVNRSIVLLECESLPDGHHHHHVRPSTAKPSEVDWQPGCFIDEKPPPKKKKHETQPCLPPHVSIFKRIHPENVTEFSGYVI